MQLAPITGLRMARSFVSLVRDPRNLDDVLDLSDRIAQHERAAELLAESNPALAELAREVVPWTPPSLASLRALPDGTVGREYARFMDDNGLVPEALERDPLDGEDPLERLRANMRATHDLWHVAAGWTPDLLGELGLQAFYLAQIRVPFPAFVLAGGLLHTVLKERAHFYDIVDAIAEGWRQGCEAEPLAAVDWNARMDQPLDALRQDLGLTPARRRPEPVVPLVA